MMWRLYFVFVQSVFVFVWSTLTTGIRLLINGQSLNITSDVTTYTAANLLGSSGCNNWNGAALKSSSEEDGDGSLLSQGLAWLQCYATAGKAKGLPVGATIPVLVLRSEAIVVGLHTLNAVEVDPIHSLKAPNFNLSSEKLWFQSLLSNSTCTATSWPS
jgi:hypothetical protein